VLELLVEMGNALIDKCTSSGWTALHWAACGGKLEPAKYLVARGCNTNVLNDHGRTALVLATQYNRAEVVQVLTSVSNLTTSNYNYHRGLVSLCAPFHSPHLERKTHCLRDTTMLSLKAVEKRGDAAAKCTLLSLLFQQEPGLIRHSLSFV
jgi:hypothetical protein